MIELIDIAYVRSSTPDIEESIRFATEIVGLEVSGRDEDAVYLRADERHHCVAFVPGPAGMLAAGLTVGGLDELEQAESELAEYGLEVARGTEEEAEARRVDAFFGFTDPAGNHVELCVDQARIGRPVAFSRDAGITEFGHLCLDAKVPREIGRAS